MPHTPFAYGAGAIEIALVVAGLLLLWKERFSAKARENPTPARLTAWESNIFQFMLFIWAVIAGGILVQIVFVQLLKLGHHTVEAQQVLVGAGFQFGMLSGCLAFVRFAEGGSGYSLPQRPFLRAGIATFLIALPAVFAVGLAWTTLLEAFGLPVEHQQLIDLFKKTDSPVVVGLMVFLAVVVAPVTEELIFRAGIFRFLRTRTPRWVALLVPALLFAALHGNLASLAQLAVLGIIFALAYERTGNIAVPMLAHGLFNLNTLLLLLAGIDA